MEDREGMYAYCRPHEAANVQAIFNPIKSVLERTNGITVIVTVGTIGIMTVGTGGIITVGRMIVESIITVIVEIIIMIIIIVVTHSVVTTTPDDGNESPGGN
jgi:hypothetical protein